MDEDTSSRRKVVQIDDSGIGSPVGGAAIGVLDMSTGAFKYKLVGVEYFQDEFHRNGDYQGRVAEIVRELFDDIGINKEDYRAEICSGHIFEKVRLWFDEAGYEWKSVKIEDPLQFKIEDAFSDFLVGIGVPEQIRKIEVGRDQFMFLFNWVKESPDARVKYCKTNGNKWKTKWSHRLYEKPLRIRAH